MKPFAALMLGILYAAAVRAEPAVAISAQRIRNDVRILSSDEFMGRGPGEPGEAKASGYIPRGSGIGLAEAFKNAGLQRESDLARVAKPRHLSVTDEPSPEAGWYFRSDHFPFARRGVPALAFRAGRDLVDGGTAAGQRMVSKYNADCYHQPCDEFDPGWTFAGTVQEATVAWLVGKGVANSADWPTWNAGNEYEALRRKTDDDRSQGPRRAAAAPKAAD